MKNSFYHKCIMTSMIQIQKLALEELHAFLQNPSYTPWILKMSHAGLDELNEENGKRIKQQNGKGGASSDSCHENPLR